MSSPIRKELRQLWAPVAAIAAAALLIQILTVFEARDLQTDVFSNLKGVISLAMLAGILLVGSAAFGWEFHHQTLSMLLAQPSPRSRVWKDKLFATGAWIAVLGVWIMATHVLGSHLSPVPAPAANQAAPAGGSFVASDLGFLLLFTPPAVCAAFFWTLVSRSTIGGMTFNAATQFLTAVLVHQLAEKLLLEPVVVFAVASILYSVTFLWLGWRVFARLQVVNGVGPTEAPDEDADFAPGHFARRGLGRFVRCAWMDRPLRAKPSGATANLFRKELRLLRPVYQLGLFFAVCWLVVLVLVLVQPEKGYQNLFDILIAFLIPLAFLLAGSISTNDENSLGIPGWHLTFPVSAGRQWIVKLVSSAGTGAVVGWGLPLLLALATGLIDRAAYSSRWVVGDPGEMMIFFSLVFFVLSFWSVNLLGSTVKAVLMTLVGILVLFFTFIVAHWCAGFYRGNTFSPEFLPYVLPGFFVALSGIALLQTFWLFRRANVSRRPVIAYPAVLVTGIILLGVTVSLMGR